MVMVPVGVMQVGCTVTDAVGADGGVGAVLTVNGVLADTHNETVFLTVTL